MLVLPLDKGVARTGPVSGAQPMSEASVLGLACEARLAVSPDKLTELVITRMNEH